MIHPTTSMRLHLSLFALAGWAVLTPIAARAQSPDWNAFLSVRPDPSAYLADWETDPSVVMLVLSYSGSGNAVFHLDGEIRRGSSPVLAGRSTTFEFIGPSQLLLTTRDGIWEPNSVTYDPSVSDRLQRTGRMPDGEYQFCVDVREGLSESQGGVLLARECVDFSITAPAPPSLVTPADGDTVFVPLPTFAWTPVTAGLNAGVTYHLRIAEVLPNQTPLEAVNGNTPQVEIDLPISLFAYPQTELPLVDSARYVWQVQALDAAGQPFGEQQGKSEVWTFTMAGWTGIPQPIVARMPDTLTLVPGVARLRGLRGVDGAESPTAYTLNGNVALDILSPFTAEATVSLEDVSIERAWLLDLIDGVISEDEPAEVLSGRIRGVLDTLAFPEGGPGGPSFVRLRDVDYTPAAGLAFGAELLLPGRDAVPLSGRVRLDGTTVAGTLSAEAPDGSTLFEVGEDPVRLAVRRVDVTFPAGVPRLTGRLDLFAEGTACDGVTATVGEDGVAAAAVACSALERFRLFPGVEHVTVALDSVRGDVEVDLAESRITAYDLETTGAVHIARDELLIGCAATFRMTLGMSSGDVGAVLADIEAFGSECMEDSEADGGAEFDWLGLRLTNVRLERLVYDTRTGFDASLLLDIEPRVDAVPGLTLPRIVGVSVGTDGLRVPATEIDRAGTRVDVLGFGFRLTRYRLPAFTLAWSDWRLGSPDAFRFDVEAELSLPDVAATPASCRARPLVLSGVSLGSGRLSGSVDEQGFDPSCALAIAEDVRLEIDRVGGPFAVRFTPELALEASPDVEGSLTLPPLFQCADSTARRVELPDARLNIGARGRVTGVVSGLEPACPLELPAAEVSLRAATLTFGEIDARQSAVLAGDASAVLRLAATPTTGTGSAAIDLVTGRLVSGNIDFPGPLRLDLPRERPVLSFEVALARLDAEGLRVDGRNRLLLADDQSINTTFEALTLDPDSLAITAGRVLFDAPFGLEVGLAATGDLSWRAVPTGQPIGTSIGVRADLPSEIALGPAGFTASGDGTARFVYAERDLDGLTVAFTSDFAVGLSPAGVRTGQAEFRLDGDRVAFLNSSGLQPDLDYFGDVLIPTQLPLPTLAVAYATLRDADGELLVQAENTPTGIRVFTPDDEVPIAVPALQRDALVPPTVMASFDVTLDGLAREVRDGTIAVQVPPGQQADFALFADGPQRVRVTDLTYRSDEGLTLGGELMLPGASATRFTGRARVTALGLFGTLTADAAPGTTLLTVGEDPMRLRVSRASLALPSADVTVAASLDLFRQELGCDQVAGRIAGDTLTAAVSCAPTRPVGLIDDVDRLQLGLRAIEGSASVDVTSGQLLAHRLVAASEIRLDAIADAADSTANLSTSGEPALCSAEFELTIADGVVVVTPDSFEAHCDAAEGDTEMGWLALRLSNIELQRLEYRPGTGFDFALSLDADPSVPALPELDLPQLIGIQIGTDGMLVPEVDAPLTTERLDVAGFGVRVTRARLPAFTLAWTDWQARSADGFRFAFEGDLTLPEVGGGALACLDADPILLGSAELASGRVELDLGERRYTPGCPIPLGPELAFEVERLSGSVAVQVAPELLVERTPDVEGALLLPSFFVCGNAESARMAVPGSLRLGVDRRLTGTVTGLAPTCPIDLAALEVTISEGALELTVAADTQSVVLAGAAAGTFALADNPVSGSGTMAVDLVRGRMLSGTLDFDGPFRLDLPRSSPALSFLIEEASLDTAGVHIAGGQRLTLAGGQNIDATFDRVTINPAALALTGGAIRFEAPFAFEVSISDEGSLTWRAVAREAPLSVATGLRIDLPTEVALTPEGLVSAGDAGAALRFRGRDVDSLRVAFSDDFAVALDPFGVTDGRADLLLAGESVAHVDRQGFSPNFAYFARELLPAQLGLPTVDVAYLQLRDEAGNLLVESESTGSGTRVATRPAATVPLVVPALQLDRAEAPRLDVAFEVVLNDLGDGLSAGAIRVRVPPGQREVFDLSSSGLPLRIDTLAYESDGGSAYAFTLGGSLVLFGDSAITGGAVELTLDGAGRLTGEVAAELTQRVPLLPGDGRLALSLTRAEGTFDADLAGGALTHDLELTGAVELTAAAGDSRSVDATLHLSERGVSVTRIEAQGDEIPAFFDAGIVRLGFTNLRVPRLEYAYETGVWDFELLFDARLSFPALDSLELPPVRDVVLRPTGISIPAWSVPELALEPFALSGFSVRPLAFRSDALAFDWLSGQMQSDPGFAFDLEVAFPTSAPPELRQTRLSVLDAGYSAGGLNGTIEPRDLPEPLRLPLAENGLALDLRALGGALGIDSVGAQTVAITAEGSLVLPSTMRCEAAPSGELALPGATIMLSSTGRISGSASGVLPECPALVGPLALRMSGSLLTFDVGADGRQRAELFAAAELRLPGLAAGDTVSATGEIGLDLAVPRVTRGTLEIDSPFRWNLPWSGQSAEQSTEGVPLFSFIVNEAAIDDEGLHLTGSGQAEFYDWELVDVGTLGQAGAIAEGTAEVVFEDLTLALPDYEISAGSVGFTESFAFDAGFEQSKPRWRATDESQPRRDGPGLRVTLPPDVSLSADGIEVGGTATAELTFGTEAFTALSVTFADDFLFGYDPVGVTSGRATFLLDGSAIAYVDPTGFWPGDVFGVLPIPARLGLPSEDIAYLQLRDATDQLLVESRVEDGGVTLRTRDNQSIELVIPALTDASGEPARVSVEFDVTANAASYQLTGGSVRAVAEEGGDPLFRMASVPLEVREVAYEPGEDGHELRVDARLTLPAALGGLDVVLNDLLVGENGLSGTAEVGTYTERFDPNLTPVASQALAENVDLDVLGARVAFGDSTRIDVSGVVRTPFFSPPQGGPAAIFFAGSHGLSGLTLAVDPLSLPEGTLPLGLLTFEPQAIGEEPATRITVTDEELTVRMSGVLRAPTLSDEFAATIQGLEIGTRGVVLPTVSLAESEDQQVFSLFGATFALRDSTGVYPAIALEYEGGVVGVVMSGEVTFLGHAARFYGLRVTSEGAVSLAEANLLAEPIALAENVLTLDSLAIVDDRLRAAFGVTLPEPLGDGEVQRVAVSIAPDGTVEGTGTVVVREEDPGLGGERTQVSAGIATVHPRYIGLTIDPTELDRSSVEVVADVYLRDSEDNRIQIGDVTGGTVSPGLTVGFDGSVEWGNVSLPREFEFDFEAVRLTLSQVSAGGTGSSFWVGMSGELALDIAAASGALAFTDVRIDDGGRVDFGSAEVQGGEITIGGMVNLQVEGFAYSNTPTTIEVAGGTMPTTSSAGAASTQSIDVSSYVRFGGRIDVVDVLAGGVEEVLLYETADDGRTGLIVRQAALDVYDVVSMQADLSYREIPGGFEMVLGAQGQLLDQYDVMLVGAIEQGNGTNRFGMFLATGVTIPIPAVPVVVISQLGGGFFYNPKPEYLELVRQYAGVSQTAQEKIEAPVGRFAGLLYGAAIITPAAVAEGRVLLTVMPNALQIDGAVTVLNQGNRLRGDAHLVLGTKKTYAEGNIAFDIDYDPVLNGAGEMQFYVYGPDVWGISGATEVSVVGYFDGASELFIGPPGFVVSVDVERNFDIWILEINSDFETTGWYERSSGDWGAHAEIRVKAELVDGTIEASGRLQAALLFPGSGDPMMYAAGRVEGCVVGQCADKRVWVKFCDGRVEDYGTGRNSEWDELLDEAEAVAEEIMAAADEAQEAAEQAQLGLLGLSYDELAAAYERIQGWPQARFQAVAAASTGVESNYAPQPGEGAQFGWYLQVLQQAGAPADTALIRSYADSVTAQLDRIAARRAAVSGRIGEITADIQQARSEAELLIPGSPVRQISFAPPVTRTVVDAAGDTTKILESGPGFDVDPQAAEAVRSALDEWRLEAERADQQARAQLQALETSLQQIRAVTQSGDEGSLLAYARLHAEAVSAAERQYATQADHILRKQDWMRARLIEQGPPDFQAQLLASSVTPMTTQSVTTQSRSVSLATTPTSPTQYSSQAVYALVNRYTAIRNIILNKTKALRAESFNRLRELIIYREVLLDEWLGTNGARLAAFVAMEGTWSGPSDPRYDAHADSTGMWIWYHLARAGMQAADAGADDALADVVSLSGQRLGAIRAQHGAVSSSLDRLYGSQAALTGVLYDAYDRYIGWRTETLGDSALAPRAGLDAFRARKEELALELTVPRLSGVQVTSLNQGYRSTQTFQWSGTHPRGAYEFLFRDVGQAESALGAPLFSNGAMGTLVGHRFLQARGWTEPTRSFEAGVRGGAGFIGLGRADYTVTFQQQGTGAGSSTTYVELVDATPPSAPVIELVGSAARPLGTGGSEAWTSSPDAPLVRWTASDPESGISEYEVAVGTAPEDTSVRAWTSVGGRSEIRLDGVTLSQATPVFVSVRARNGRALWGAVGVSPAFRWDPSPPAFPLGASVSASAPADGAATPTRTVLLPACTVPEPAFPLTPPTRGIDPTATQRGDEWGGYLGGDSDGGANTAGTPQRMAPQRSFSWPSASDSESGLSAYRWRIDTSPPTGLEGGGWSEVPGSQTSITVSGAPLAYQGQFYLTVVAENWAGELTEALTFGPFEVPDPTRPTNPRVCAAVGRAADRFTVEFSTLAVDPETRVVGYQYRVRSGSTTLRDWPAEALDWTDVASPGNVATQPLVLVDGLSYHVDVRARNGDGVFGDTISTGPVYVDASPPPTPTATALFGSSPATVLRLRITGAADPHSGFMTQHLAVGTSQGAANVVAWRNIPGAVPGEYVVDIPLITALTAGATYWLQVRTVNQAGLASPIYVASFTVPSLRVTAPAPLRSGR